MANTISALKRVRVAERRTDVNRVRRTRLRHGIRAMRRLLESKDSKGATALAPKTFSLIDRAAKWGVSRRITQPPTKTRSRSPFAKTPTRRQPKNPFFPYHC